MLYQSEALLRKFQVGAGQYLTPGSSYLHLQKNNSSVANIWKARQDRWFVMAF